MSHEAFREMVKWFAGRWRDGKPEVGDELKVWAWWRTHPASVTASDDEVGQPNHAEWVSVECSANGTVAESRLVIYSTLLCSSLLLRTSSLSSPTERLGIGENLRGARQTLCRCHLSPAVFMSKYVRETAYCSRSRDEGSIHPSRSTISTCGLGPGPSHFDTETRMYMIRYRWTIQPMYRCGYTSGRGQRTSSRTGSDLQFPKGFSTFWLEC